MKILIGYGSNTGNTAYVAEVISFALAEHKVTVQNIKTINIETFRDYDLLIFGTSTWSNGEVQKDWKDSLSKFNKDILSGKLVALFGLGDSVMFPEQFANGVREIYDSVVNNGAIVIGYWKNEGYNYIFSRALIGEKFCGLIIDQDNESNLTVQRVVDWIKELQKDIVNYINVKN